MSKLARTSPTPSTPAHLSMKCGCMCTIENGFQQIRKFLIYAVVSEVTKILLVRVMYARERGHHVKTKDRTCAVGQFKLSNN